MLDFDSRVLHAIYGGAQGPWGSAMTALTIVGSGWTALALLPLMAWRRTRLVASGLAAAILVQATAVWALKLVVGRVRPWIALGLPAPPGAPHDPSFPSGHAAGSFCVAAFLVVVLPPSAAVPWRGRVIVRNGRRRRHALIATSRVYLGAHYPTDVMAGALLGSLVGAAAARGVLHRSPKVAGDEEREPPVWGGTPDQKTLNVRPSCRPATRLPCLTWALCARRHRERARPHRGCARRVSRLERKQRRGQRERGGRRQRRE